MTNFQRFTFTLTAVNLILLAFGVAQLRPAIAQEVAPHFVLGHWKSWMTRGGFARRSRLSGTTDAQDARWHDGIPEAVQLRLISSQNNPNVKLVTTEDGSGLVLGGERGHTQLLSRRADPFIKIVTGDGRERTVKP